MSFVPSMALKGIDSLIESYGADPEKIMLDVGFSPKLLERPDNLVEGQQFNDLIEHSAHQLNQRFLGLQLAAIQGGSILGPLWFLLRNSANIGDGIQTLLTNFASHTDLTYFHTEDSPQGTILSYEVNRAITGEYTQIIELGLGITSLYLRRYLGASWRPRVVYLSCIEPYEKRPLVDVFGEHIHFKQEINGFVISKEEMQHPLHDASRLKQQHYEHEVTKRMDFNIKSVVVQTENIINASLTRHSCSLTFVAKCLDINPRTLRFHLQQHGTCYQTLLDKAKLNLALRYLLQSNLSMTEIAERLHFSEASVFSRFIKKNTGLTPKQNRNKSIKST